MDTEKKPNGFFDTIKSGFKKIQYNSPVILTFSFLSLIAFFLNLITKGLSNKYLFSVYRSPLTDPLSYIRIFTHVLGHADFNHYSSNFIIILLLGPILEEKYGSTQMFFMILFTAFITGVLNILLFPSIALLGASGIGFMLIILVSLVNFDFGKVPLTFILIILIFIGQEISQMVSKTDNISRVTHIIGGICGAVLGFALNYKKLKNNKIKGDE